MNPSTVAARATLPTFTTLTIPNPSSQPGPVYQEVTITPDVAEQYLSSNTHNRRLQDFSVKKYAEVMRKGLWDEGAPVAPISFDTDGVLINGQHRLWAIIESGVTLTLTVVTNAKPESFAVIDQGHKRTTGQVAQLAGVKNATAVTSMAGYLLRYDKDHSIVWTAKTPLITTEETLQYTHEYDDLLQYAYAEAMSIGVLLNIVNLNLALAMVIILRDSEHKDRYLEFAEGLRTGAGLAEGDARLALRNYKGLVDPRAEKHSTYLQKQVQVSMVLKAWNAFITGRPVKSLRYSGNEVKSNGMPNPL